MVPCRISLRTNRVRLIELDDRPQDAFFEHTIEALMAAGRRPTDEALDRWRPVGPGLLAHLVHQGRCASTLLSRLIEGATARWVVREPPILADLTDGISHGFDLGLIASAWRRAGEAFGGAAGGSVVLKCSSRQTLFLPSVLAIGHHQPTVALVRDPRSVIRSLLNDPPSWVTDLWLPPDALRRSCPGMGQQGSAVSAVDWYLDFWCTTANAILAAPVDRILVVDHDDLVASPLAELIRILEFLGDPASLDAADRSVRTVMSLDAKSSSGSGFVARDRRPLSKRSEALIADRGDDAYQLLRARAKAQRRQL